MATYAYVNEDNVVINVIKINDEDVEDENGNEIPEKVIQKKIEIFGEEFPGRLVKTSYNNNSKGLYAGIGYTFSDELDVFVRNKDQDYYVLDETTGSWVPPESPPERSQYEIDNDIIYIWSHREYERGENPWITDYCGSNYPEVIQEEGKFCRYYWDFSQYIKDNLESGFALNCVDIEPPVLEPEPVPIVGIATT